MGDAGSSLYQACYATCTITNPSPATKTLIDVRSIDIFMKRNELIRWTVVLLNTDRQYTRGNAASEFDGFMEAKNGYTWTITLGSWNDDATPVLETKTWGGLIPDDYETTVDADGNAVAIMNGYAFAGKLVEKNKTMASWVSSEGNTKTSNGIIGDILTEYAITYALNASDYPVRVMHFQGEQAIDKIKQLLKPVWGEWREDTASTFITRQPAYLPSGPADWVIEDYKTINQLRRRYSKADVITKVTVARTMPLGPEALNIEGEEVGALGPFPLDYVITPGSMNIYRESEFGEIMDLATQTDVNGNVESITFTFQQIGGLTAEEAVGLYWHIIITGSPVLSDPQWGNETTFTVTKTNTTLETELGESIPAGDPILEDLIPNQTWAGTYAENFLVESAKWLEPLSGKIGLYLEMVPGETLQVIDHYTGTNGYFYTEEVGQHVVMSGNNGEATTSVVCSKPRNDTIV